MESVPVENVVWNLGDLYSGPDDGAMGVDRIWCQKQVEMLSLYRGKVACLTPQEMLIVVRLLEDMTERAHKLIAFSYLYFSTRTQDPEASALFQAQKEFYSELHRNTLFFELEWAQLDERRAEFHLTEPLLVEYRHYLASLRRYRPHLLSEPEERVLAAKEPAGVSAWTALFDKMLSRVRFGEAKRTESEVLSDLYRTDREVRRQAALELTEGLDSVLPELTHIFNTVLLDKAIDDRMRRYSNWLSSRNLSNEADDRMVDVLVERVTTRYDLVERYYRLKRRLLNVDELFDYDRYAPIPGMPAVTFSWEEARNIVLTAFEAFSPKMADIASDFFTRHWIHAPVLPGKRSGAFAHPVVPSVHPYVMVNFIGNYRDVMTLAHELGHGVHQYLAKEQGFFNAETPLTMAESASVFGEMLVFRHLLQKMENPAERLALLCSKIEDTFATVFRQVAMNRFENAVHSARRTRGELDEEFISSAWYEAQSAMFGDSVRLLDHYRRWWCYIPHFVHSPGYVYAYAFGELLVLAFYEQYLEKGGDFVPMYLEFLTAGGKDKPEELLRPFGFDLSDPRFWDGGLRIIEDLLVEAEREAC